MERRGFISCSAIPESSQTGKENESTEDQGIHVDGVLFNVLLVIYPTMFLWSQRVQRIVILAESPKLRYAILDCKHHMWMIQRDG